MRIDPRSRAFVRAIFIGLIVLQAIALTAVVFWYVEQPKDPTTKPYTAENQQERGQAIVAALNARDAGQLALPLASRPADERARRFTDDFMPASECKYVFDSVTDRGEQPEQDVDGTPRSRIYEYDIDVTENCPGAQPQARTIGVLAVPSEGAYWADIALVRR
ncbi:MAG: hypothetical protein WAV90_11540 [Gordonia amarae]